MAKSFGVGPHIFVPIDEDHFSGRGSILHDIHRWLHQDGLDFFFEKEVKSLSSV